MGLTKQYLRYVPGGTFNIIASPQCNAAFVVLQGQEGRFVAVGGCEHILIWDLRLGEKALILPGEKAIVTCLCVSPDKRHLAAGYSDGMVQVYNLESAEVLSIFAGHKSEVTTLAYDKHGQRLASGSKDTHITVWDTVSETGVCRLSGHKGVVTKLVFMSEHNILISSSKDTFVKFWDLDSQYCFRTLAGHQTELWSLTLMKNERYLVTGCNDSELRVWKISFRDPDTENRSDVDQLTTAFENLSNFENGGDDPNYPLKCEKAGSVLRSGKGRVVSLTADATGRVLGCHGLDAQLELFLFCSDDEARNRFRKRSKREKKKEQKNEEKMDVDEAQEPQNIVLGLRDEVRQLPSIKLTNRPKSLDLVIGKNDELRVATVLANNTLELYTVMTSIKDSESKCLRSIFNQGHHSEIRAVSFSSDNMAIISGSAESVKIWNRPSQVCLRTIETGYVLSLCFVPGDRHALAGLKDGRLLILDIASGDVLEQIPAHTVELWSICIMPDQSGCVTGGSDKTVKFWTFELIVDEQTECKAKVLSLVHKKTLKLEENVLCVKISPNNKFIAVALLDSTVKIFFVDTFKFYLSLYGHKLPVQCLDISSDSALIATGSADKSVKLWGLDFGDCHRSLLAHSDNVMTVQFVPKTHYFFTCGKDGKVKQWDGDSGETIINLQGHSGEAWFLSVSPNGKFVVSSGSDRVLRLWERTDEILVLEDEKETEREQEAGLATGEETVTPGKGVVSLASKKTVSSEEAASLILECLEVSKKYNQELADSRNSSSVSKPHLPPEMQVYQVDTTDDYLLETLKRVRSSELEEALLLMPFTDVCECIHILPRLAARGDNPELIGRVSVFLLKLHAGSIRATPSLLGSLKALSKYTMTRAQELRDIVGYNLHALQWMQRDLETAEGVQLFRDATINKRAKDKKRKQRERSKRALIVLNS